MSIYNERSDSLDIELLRQYADNGLSRKQIADRMGLSYNYVKKCISKYGIFVLQENHCTDNKGATLTNINEVREKVDKAGYEYIGGFKNTHSKILVRCKECGKTFERQYANIRKQVEGKYPNKMRCPHCYMEEVEEYRRKKREPKEREAHERAERAADIRCLKISVQLMRRLAIHVCKNCGKEFSISSTGYNSELYCSEKCQKRYGNRIKNDKRIKKLNKRPHDTDITLDKLYERDGGVCYICGRRCDWQDIKEIDGTMIAGNSYPSIDHVKPVAKGGTHTWDNIKLACRLCNTIKGKN